MEKEKWEIIIFSQQYVDMFLIAMPAMGERMLKRSDDVKGQAFIRLYAIEEQWYFHFIGGAESEEQKLFVNQIYEFIDDCHQKVLMYTKEYEKRWHQFFPYSLHKEILCIGRGSGNDIQFNHPLISNEHAKLIKDQKGWKLMDVNSRNGVYVNHQRVHECYVVCGDVIWISDMQIIMGCHDIWLVHDSELVFAHLQEKKNHNYLTKEIVSVSYIRPMPFSVPIFHEKEFTIEEPKRMQMLNTVPLWYVLGPSIAMGMTSLCTMMYAVYCLVLQNEQMMSNIPMLIMSAGMVISSILWPLISHRYEVRKQKQQEIEYHKQYQTYMEKKQIEITGYIQEKEQYLKAMYETSEQAFSYLMSKQGLLFHRMKQDVTFGCLCIGICDRNAEISVPHHEEDFFASQDENYKLYENFVKREYQLQQVPLIIDFKKIHHLGIAADMMIGYSYLLSCILQMSLLHDPTQFRVVILVSAKDSFDHGVRYLRSIFSSQNDFRYLICEKKDVRRVFTKIKEDIDKGDMHFLIVSFDSYFNDSLLLYHELLLETHVFYLQLASRKEELYPLCQNVVMLYGSEKGIWQNEYGSHSFSYSLLSHEQFVFYQWQYQSLCLSQDDHKPDVLVSLMDLYACGSVEQLCILQRWRSNDSVHSLQAVIGFDDEHNKIVLDAHEASHGPHGLVAGMTGSGKSECLITYILSLAIEYSCENVAFLLIDYKGGLMAKSLQQLPHVAGIMTNLDEKSMRRLMLSLQSELRSRQLLFQKTQQQYHITSIDIYKYQQMYKDHIVEKPLPHLFIMIDEFAELKMQQPQFLEQLQQYSRIGRSLGIHLILATQKPAGIVDDQIWSNTRFHLCFKVQDRSDSFDVIKKEDAISLQRAGDFYLQVGNDEVFVKGRCALSKVPYQKQKYYQRSKQQEIVFVDHILMKTKVKAIEEKNVYRKTQMEVLCEYIATLANRENVKKMTLSLHPLAKNIDIEDINLFDKEGLVGVVDAVHMQSQYPLQIKLTDFHHLLICGKPYSGKTQLLETWLINQLLYHDHILVYLLDFEQRFDRSWIQVSCIQDVIYLEEKDKLQTFFLMITKEIELRKLQSIDDSKWIILLHGYELFIESFQEQREFLYYLLREGLKYEIHVIITCGDPQRISYQLLSLIDTRMIFALLDQSLYGMLLSDKSIQPLDQKGSAVYQKGKECYLFQCAFYKEEKKKEILGQHFNNQKWRPVPRLPKRIQMKKSNQDHLFFGLYVDTKECFEFEWKNTSYLYVIGHGRIFANFCSLLYKQLQQKDSYLIRISQKTQAKDILRDVKENHDSVILWHEIQQWIADEAICLENRNFHHIVCIDAANMKEVSMQSWFCDHLEDSCGIVIGSVIEEYGYLFHKRIMQSHCARNQAIVWEDGECYKIQVMEEDQNG